MLPLRPGHPERRTHDYVRTRHHQPLRRVGRRLRAGHRRPHRSASGPGVPQLLEPDQPLRCPTTSTCTSSSTTPPRTRRPRSIAGCCATRASPSTSRPPTAHGSTWSSAGSRSSPSKWLRRGTHRSTKELERAIHALDQQLERQPSPVRLAQERRRDPGRPLPPTASGSPTQITSLAMTTVRTTPMGMMNDSMRKG